MHDQSLWDRRTFLMAGSLLLPPATGFAAAPKAVLGLGPATPFSFAELVVDAKALAAADYAAPKTLAKDVLAAIDDAVWEQAQARPARGWPAGTSPGFAIAPFPPGAAYPATTRLFVVTGQGKAARARELAYDPALFAAAKDSPLARLPERAGFGGFQVRGAATRGQSAASWVLFAADGRLRAIGSGGVYGAWAEVLRTGDAADKLTRSGRFTRFYLEPKAHAQAPTVVDALFDAPDVAGAWRFTLRHGRTTTMDVEAHLFVRRDLKALALAPLRSMYWFSETVKNTALDWHPEIHDSDGVALAGGTPDYLWCALCNPAHTQRLTFPGAGQQGFGVCQRDRDFNHYLSHAFYERRPTVWLQPQGKWPAGAVQLVADPIDQPRGRNVSVHWLLDKPPQAGAALDLKWRLSWGMDEPAARKQQAHCVATRMGLAFPGVPDKHAQRRFVVAFWGGPLQPLALTTRLTADVSATHGKISDVRVEPVPDDVRGHWRALFDLTPEGTDPCDLRLVLRHGKQVLSETWAYRYLPV